MIKHLISKALLCVSMLSVSTTSFGQDKQVPAFPGAEGFARYTTTGGRDGEVYHVTSLEDSGPGTLRDAISQSNRTIVFDVSGYIDLESILVVTSNNLTIAGQTAPGDGITVRYHTMRVEGSNLIFRFLRFRRSQVKDVNDGADATWGRRLSNVIFDHCSFSWSIDEIASYYDNANFTMQWCTLGEALANPGHSKGQHSYGGIWGGKGASFHHNFLAHMQNRAPRFNGARYNYKGNLSKDYENCIQAERVDFRNCVMYNWGKGGCYGGPGGGQINIVNNYYKAGPGTLSKACVTLVSVANASNGGKELIFPGYASRYFIQGNYVARAKRRENYDWDGVLYEPGLTTIDGQKYIQDNKHYYGKGVKYTRDASGNDYVSVKLDKAIAYGEVTTHTAEVAYEKVLEFAGASLSRDAVDARYMEETRQGIVTYTGLISKTAGIVDSINTPGMKNPSPSCPNFPVLKAEKRKSSYDSDGDGMPDEWEKAQGLNRKDPSDGKAKTLDPKGWYTNLEVYLNSVVEDIVKKQNADAIEKVDEYYPAVKPVVSKNNKRVNR